MAHHTLSALIMLFAASVPCAILGYLIGVKQKRHFIAGWSWNKNKFKSPEAYAKLIGLSLMVLALGIATLALLVWYQVLSEFMLTVFLLLLSLIPIFAIVYGNKKYTKHIN